MKGFASMQQIEISLLDNLPGYIGWKDSSCNYIGANKALMQLKGLKDLDQIVGKKDEDLTPWSVEQNIMFQKQDLSVLNGDKLSTIHFDKSSNTAFQLQKYPLTDHKNAVKGLIYHCQPYTKDNIYSLLKKLDEGLSLNTSYYSIGNHPNKYKLTRRELECVFLLTRGKSAKEISVLLSLSKRTIESYIENIKNKMHCNNKAELLVKAVINDYHSHIPERLNQQGIIKSL